MEFDESYFGARRVSGKRGCGAGGKIPVFGIVKRDGKVYTQIVTNCSAKELLQIIEGNVEKILLYIPMVTRVTIVYVIMVIRSIIG